MDHATVAKLLATEALGADTIRDRLDNAMFPRHAVERAPTSSSWRDYDPRKLALEVAASIRRERPDTVRSTVGALLDLVDWTDDDKEGELRQVRILCLFTGHCDEYLVPLAASDVVMLWRLFRPTSDLSSTMRDVVLGFGLGVDDALVRLPEAIASAWEAADKDAVLEYRRSGTEPFWGISGASPDEVSARIVGLLATPIDDPARMKTWVASCAQPGIARFAAPALYRLVGVEAPTPLPRFVRTMRYGYGKAAEAHHALWHVSLAASPSEFAGRVQDLATADPHGSMAVLKRLDYDERVFADSDSRYFHGLRFGHVVITHAGRTGGNGRLAVKEAKDPRAAAKLLASKHKRAAAKLA